MNQSTNHSQNPSHTYLWLVITTSKTYLPGFTLFKILLCLTSIIIIAPNCYPASNFASYNPCSIQMNLLKLLIKWCTPLLPKLQWFPITRTQKPKLPPESTEPLPAPFHFDPVLQPISFFSDHADLCSNTLPSESPALTTLSLFIISSKFNSGIAPVLSLLFIYLLFVIGQRVDLLGYWLLLPTRRSYL